MAVTTSSPRAGVALLRDREIIDEAYEDAPMRASGATMRLLAALLTRYDAKPQDPELFCADVGPGSFTGVRVGVTLMKTMAYAFGRKTAGVSTFDLMRTAEPDTEAQHETLAVPARRTSYLLRSNGEISEVEPDDSRLKEAAGYGGAFDVQRYPAAGRAASLLDSLEILEPFELMPEYVLEPSISKPKRPFPEVRR